MNKVTCVVQNTHSISHTDRTCKLNTFQKKWHFEWKFEIYRSQVCKLGLLVFNGPYLLWIEHKQTAANDLKSSSMNVNEAQGVCLCVNLRKDLLNQ